MVEGLAPRFGYMNRMALSEKALARLLASDFRTAGNLPQVLILDAELEAQEAQES